MLLDEVEEEEEDAGKMFTGPGGNELNGLFELEFKEAAARIFAAKSSKFPLIIGEGQIILTELRTVQT